MVIPVTGRPWSRRRPGGPGGNGGSLSHTVLYTMHAMQLLPRRWQDFLSNKTEFCTVLRSFSSVVELSFLRASCRDEENEVLDFSLIASDLIIRHSRNNSFARSQRHFLLTVKESSIFLSSHSVVILEKAIWKPGVFVTRFVL